MATAQYNKAVVETKVIEVSPESVTLTLSMEEASFLRKVLGQFSSGHRNSPIYYALADIIPFGFGPHGRVAMKDEDGHLTHRRTLHWVGFENDTDE